MDQSTAQAAEAIKIALSGKTLNQLARDLQINRGQLSNVMRGKRPASNRVLRALGLPPRLVPAEPCPECGEAHIVGWCTRVEGAPRRPAHHRPMRTWKVDGFDVRAKSAADAVKKLIAQDSIVRTSATVEDDQGRGAMYAVEQVTTVRCKKVKETK